jgi:hypothetical protein
MADALRPSPRTTRQARQAAAEARQASEAARKASDKAAEEARRIAAEEAALKASDEAAEETRRIAADEEARQAAEEAQKAKEAKKAADEAAAKKAAEEAAAKKAAEEAAAKKAADEAARKAAAKKADRKAAKAKAAEKKDSQQLQHALVETAAVIASTDGGFTITWSEGDDTHCSAGETKLEVLTDFFNCKCVPPGQKEREPSSFGAETLVDTYNAVVLRAENARQAEEAEQARQAAQDKKDKKAEKAKKGREVNRRLNAFRATLGDVDAMLTETQDEYTVSWSAEGEAKTAQGASPEEALLNFVNSEWNASLELSAFGYDKIVAKYHAFANAKKQVHDEAAKRLIEFGRALCTRRVNISQTRKGYAAFTDGEQLLSTEGASIEGASLQETLLLFFNEHFDEELTAADFKAGDLVGVYDAAVQSVDKATEKAAIETRRLQQLLAALVDKHAKMTVTLNGHKIAWPVGTGHLRFLGATAAKALVLFYNHVHDDVLVTSDFTDGNLVRTYRDAQKAIEQAATNDPVAEVSNAKDKRLETVTEAAEEEKAAEEEESDAKEKVLVALFGPAPAFPRLTAAAQCCTSGPSMGQLYAVLSKQAGPSVLLPANHCYNHPIWKAARTHLNEMTKSRNAEAATLRADQQVKRFFNREADKLVPMTQQMGMIQKLIEPISSPLCKQQLAGLNALITAALKETDTSKKLMQSQKVQLEKAMTAELAYLQSLGACPLKPGTTALAIVSGTNGEGMPFTMVPPVSRHQPQLDDVTSELANFEHDEHRLKMWRTWIAKFQEVLTANAAKVVPLAASVACAHELTQLEALQEATKPDLWSYGNPGMNAAATAFVSTDFRGGVAPLGERDSFYSEVKSIYNELKLLSERKRDLAMGDVERLKEARALMSNALLRDTCEWGRLVAHVTGGHGKERLESLRRIGLAFSQSPGVPLAICPGGSLRNPVVIEEELDNDARPAAVSKLAAFNERAQKRPVHEDEDEHVAKQPKHGDHDKRAQKRPVHEDPDDDEHVAKKPNAGS